MTIEKAAFGTTEEGQEVTVFTLSGGGNRVRLIDYGAIIISVEVPDAEGTVANVNLGFPSLEGYLGRHSYLGSTVGRFCNRIAKGRFELDGVEYKELVINNGPNHLHGGTVGFDKLLWTTEEIANELGSGVRFRTTSPDGQEGYPGTLQVTAEYCVNEAGDLAYRFSAETDKATVINMTNHSYWNLGGVDSGDILDHIVHMNCDNYLEVDDTLIPTGKILPAAGTLLDFAQPQRVGDRVEQLPATKGYDHCYVVNGTPGELRLAGKVVDPSSGRWMEVHTTQPGVQLYTGNHLGGQHMPYNGLCLETQHFPDSPNKPEFPTTVLRPGETFQETTVHKFGC